MYGDYRPFLPFPINSHPCHHANNQLLQLSIGFIWKEFQKSVPKIISLVILGINNVGMISVFPSNSIGRYTKCSTLHWVLSAVTIEPVIGHIIEFNWCIRSSLTQDCAICLGIESSRAVNDISPIRILTHGRSSLCLTSDNVLKSYTDILLFPLSIWNRFRHFHPVYW